MQGKYWRCPVGVKQIVVARSAATRGSRQPGMLMPVAYEGLAILPQHVVNVVFGETGQVEKQRRQRQQRATNVEQSTDKIISSAQQWPGSTLEMDPRRSQDQIGVREMSGEHHSERSSLEDEQEQGLLGGWKEAHHEFAEDKPAPGKRRRLGIVAWCMLGLVALLAATITLVFVTDFGSIVFRPEGASSVITSNEYILDPDWDYQAPPQRREYTWTVRDHEHNPDGIYRPMILVNNQFPGPLVEVNEGDTIVVRVDNQAVNATAIHWHGMYQNGTPHMDGTVGVTQCAIAPGQRFTYEFTVNGQSGTYWWHGHQGVQTSDGLHGPLIIHGRDERKLQEIRYDTDRVILLSDHYHDLSSALLFQYLMPDMENTEPVPESGLINGKTIRNCGDYPGRKCDNTTANVGIPTLKIERNKSHRLRIVNVGAFAEFQFQIDEHELAVTEVDGTDVHPQSYHRLNINPAQRYSVIISSNITTSNSFWLRARMVTKCFTDAPKTLQPDTLAIVHYDDASATTKPTSSDWQETLAQECRDLNTTELHPVQPIPAPPKPSALFYLRSNFEIGAYRLSRGFFNTSSWRADPRSPTLHRAIDGLLSANASFTSPFPETPAFVNTAAFNLDTELVIQSPGIQTLDFLISNFDDGAHPIHLHGYKFFVLASGHGQPPLTSPSAAITTSSLAPLYETLDLSNPLRRDTTSVEAFGWVLIRVVADNPGLWALHCHVSWHAEAGLLMQVLTRSEALAGMEVPEAGRELCGKEGVERGMGWGDEGYEQFAK